MSLFGKQDPEQNVDMDDAVLDDGGVVDDESAQSMSLLSGVGGGGMNDDALLAMDQQASGGILANNGLVIGLVVVCAGLGIWGMRYLISNNDQSLMDQAVVSRIEDFIAKQSGGPATAQAAETTPEAEGPSLDETIRQLSEPWRDQQVRREELAKNPFVVAVSKKEKDNRNADKLAEQRAAIDKAIASYRIDAVMGGKRPVAMINGEMYQQGQALGDFKVASIEEGRVYLTHPALPENIFELTVQKDDEPRRRR